MNEIILLDSETVDKIAAGEVVEKPVNAVKELIENSIDSGATIISVEIKNGGIDLIRVTDNGSGIPTDQVKSAFLRHATSKLSSIKDLESLHSLGFRGEALSSISAVSKTELITKTGNELLGTRAIVEGGKLCVFENIGVPEGTTVIVSQLFYNTPARKKFLKSASSEASAVEDLVEKIALSHPGISFSFTANSKVRFSTAGNGILKDTIYKLMGREVYSRLLDVELTDPVITVRGCIARPEYNLATREGEIFFVNDRFIGSKELSYALEQGFKNFLMQHRFPFGVLFIDIDPKLIDVNVHPRKSEIKSFDAAYVCELVTKAVNETLREPELIPVVTIGGTGQSADSGKPVQESNATQQGFSSSSQSSASSSAETSASPQVSTAFSANSSVIASQDAMAEENVTTEDFFGSNNVAEDKPVHIEPFETSKTDLIHTDKPLNIKSDIPRYEQSNMFEDRLIDDKPLKEYTILGQVFDTYWLISQGDNLFLMDQHAAHEKINYERFLKAYKNDYVADTQYMDPPMLIGLTRNERESLDENMDLFVKIGFEIDDFGSDSIAIRGVPMELFSNTEEEMFKRLLFEVHEYSARKDPEAILEKLASMSCKAAIKGNTRVNEAEIKNIMNELMTLDNPYNCPHGRPTLICITKTELDRKFKRIV